MRLPEFLPSCLLSCVNLFFFQKCLFFMIQVLQCLLQEAFHNVIPVYTHTHTHTHTHKRTHTLGRLPLGCPGSPKDFFLLVSFPKFAGSLQLFVPACGGHRCQPVLGAAKSLQSCPTLCDPMDGSPPGSAVPGILQARTLEWVAISFSSA